MDIKKASTENRAYFEFIDELRKSSRQDSPTAEISRMYKEVADILGEAFDEFNPEDLPKYQERLDGIIRLQETQPSLADPLFKEDIQKAKSLLDQKVKQRFGALQKMSRIASGTLRTFGGISSHVRDFVSIGDQSAEAGRRFSQISFGLGKGRLDPEEERRQYDILKGTEPQYTGNQSNSPGSAQLGTTAISDGKQILPVKDDKLIGTNNQQNKVLLQLFHVTKDSNADIKQIKALIKSDSAKAARIRSKDDLNQKEDKQESKASVKAADKGILGGLLSIFGNGHGPNSAPNEETSDPMPAKDAVGLLGKGGIIASIGAMLLSKIGAASGGALIGGVAGSSFWGRKAKPIRSKLQSAATTAGEWMKGEEYHKDVLRSDGHDLTSQNNAEESALEYLDKVAKQKRELKKRAFNDGSRFGDGSYVVNGKPLDIDEAAVDAQSAEDKAKEYKAYIEAKKKKNPNLSSTAKFTLDDKEYRNPIFSEQERRQIDESAKAVPNDNGWLDSENFWSSALQKGSNLLSSKPSQEIADGDKIDTITVPKGEIDTVMRGIAAAETGPVTGNRDLNDKSRAIRTTGGANSSAYGTYQITYSLADSHVKNGLFDSDPALKKWTKERFVPHGKKLLHSSYSDPRYGAGGQGDLNSEEDRLMYQKMSKAIIGESYSRNKGDMLAVLGEHRFGHSKKHTLLHADPQYAQRAMAQWKKDQQITLASNNQKPNVNPVSQAGTQVALNQLSKEQEASRSAPVVVAVPTPQPVSHQPQSNGGVSTKTVGASPNGASESSLMLGLRHSISPI